MIAPEDIGVVLLVVSTLIVVFKVVRTWWTENRPPVLNKFCTYCGCAMQPHWTFESQTFDGKTGKGSRWEQKMWVCPKYLEKNLGASHTRHDAIRLKDYRCEDIKSTCETQVYK